MSFSMDVAAPPRIARSAVPYLLLGAVVIGCTILGPRYGSPGSLVMAAIVAASFTASIAGFAFSAICGAMLFHLSNDQVQAVQIMIACSIANQATMVWALRHSIDRRNLGIFLLGGASGLPLGVWALLHADKTLYTHALGVLLIAYGAYMLASTPRVLQQKHRGLDLAAGFLGGITGGAVGFPGASVTIWLGFKGWNKIQQRAVYQPFILLMQVAALFAISILRRHSGPGIGLDPAILLCVPAGLFGTRLGMACFQQMSNRQFTLAVNVLLFLSGLSYVI